MKKALFWDFDGTLTVSRSLWTGSLHRALQAVAPGLGIPPETIRPLLQTGFPWHAPENDYRQLAQGDAWWESLTGHFERVCRALGLAGEAAGQAAGMVRGFVLDPGNYELYPDAVPVLRACADAGYGQYILSNNYPELPEVAGRLGISGFFRGFVVSARVGYEKPRREIFEAARKAAGDPDFCVMIGDNPSADIAGAKAAGMPAILVHRDASGSGADHVCGALSEIPAILGIRR